MMQGSPAGNHLHVSGNLVAQSPGPKFALDMGGDSAVAEEDVSKEKVNVLPPRTIAYPFVGEAPPVCYPMLFDEVKESCVMQSKMFKVETPDQALDEYVQPVDDSVDPNTYVGDWEELFIRTYDRVFGGQEHQLYWCKCDVGLVLTAAGRAVEDLGHPTLSLGPNGFHFYHLPAVPEDFPAPKHLVKLFPHFEEVKFTHVKDADKLSSELMSFEQKMKPTRYKFGVLYMKSGQIEENDIYGNLDPSVGFIDFLKQLGSLIELQKHKGYRGGLDCSGANTTGEISLYTRVDLADGRYVPQGSKPPMDTQEQVALEVMFHVAPFLPYSSQKEDGNQQLHKKRHLGNDICVVIFKDGNTKLNPEVFKSQFNHVYIVVTPCVGARGGANAATHYKVEVVTKGLKGFLPKVPENGIIPAERIGDWLLLKLINGEVTAMRAKDLQLKMKRTRVQTLESWRNTDDASSLSNSRMGRK